jgi:phosphohistidine phosphatase
MFLYLVQHAEAKREEEDPARDLTAQGLSDIRRVAGFAGKLPLAVSRILHSGKTRALRTAEVLAASLDPAKGVAAADGLAPLDPPGIWAERISSLTENLMLVGHLPHLARLAAMLLCGDPEIGVVNFQMGGLVCLKRGETGRWAVAWMVVPEVLT